MKTNTKTPTIQNANSGLEDHAPFGQAAGRAASACSPYQGSCTCGPCTRGEPCLGAQSHKIGWRGKFGHLADYASNLHIITGSGGLCLCGEYDGMTCGELLATVSAEIRDARIMAGMAKQNNELTRPHE